MPTKVNGYAARNGTNHSREHTVFHIDYSALTVQIAHRPWSGYTGNRLLLNNEI
jgi:hypothetical protein